MMNTTTSLASHTLSWKEARDRLRLSLESYLRTPVISVSRSRTNLKTRPFGFSTCLKWDLDILCGALGSTTALLIVAIVGFIQSDEQENSGTNPFQKSQLAGAIVVFLGCVVNIWLIFRYRYSASRGTEPLKRRMINRFLKELKKQEQDSVENLPDEGSQEDNGIDLIGTALTDIYPVYRLNQDSNGNITSASWSRIPTLLLVKGDRIALQIGDIAPALCRRLLGGGEYSTIIHTGEKVSLENVNGNKKYLFESFAKGRTTLPVNSDELLNVCNDMRIFELLETPLEAFLRQPEHELKSPQIFRQLDAVRGVLAIIGVAVFLATLIILLGRYQQFSSNILYLLPSPFLAALGSFPLVGPGLLILIESLGSARILASYHPVASRVRTESSAAEEANTNVDILILRYFLATLSNRLSLQEMGRNLDFYIRNSFGRVTERTKNSTLVRVPPASLNVLEKLGVATAFTLVDDELVCEPQAIPQQLLIPSGKGLKLLDLCPTYEDDSDDDSEHSDSSAELRRHRQRSFDMEQNYDSDSDSDDALKDHHHVPSRKRPRRRLLRKSFHLSAQRTKEAEEDDSDSDFAENEVQFEDPTWWQHLPSLKCIGLACLLVDQKDEPKGKVCSSQYMQSIGESVDDGSELDRCKTALVHLVCKERRSVQLRSLAQCIGFSTKPNISGSRGDISAFTEKLRLHVVSTARVKDRLKIDSHERSSEESRWWGLLRADSTSVIVQDKRSGAYQLLTVGDPKVVTRMCHEAWQGENSTILPLASHDRSTILETSDSLKLADLDVEAFSYTPISHTFESRCKSNVESKVYLLDNDPRRETVLSIQKDKTESSEWTLLHNQIFLGILGSLVIPRSETQGLLSSLQDAGVRFVYFSPRNMRRQKEIASQMGIDVAWNCAISLRSLDVGEDDPHRMVSNYADWDVNAKLPHGIESVKRHLKDVDNVPLLVSLFTDATKTTTMEMIEIFQNYNDTVIAVGLSHLPRNAQIFSSADLSIGVDVLSDCIPKTSGNNLQYNALLPSEVVFASAISANFCAFRLRGVASIEHMPTILAQGRASLAAVTAASIYLLSSYLSFSFYVLFTVSSVSTAIPYVPITGAIFYLFVILPLVGVPMAMSDPEKRCMQQVPPKNEASVDFGKREGKTFFLISFFKALPPAIFPQLLYLIAYGEFVIEFEPDLVKTRCLLDNQPEVWTSVIRCDGLNDYTGLARDYAVSLSIAELVFCTILASNSFVYRTLPIWVEPPWKRNHLWVFSVVIAIAVTIIYLLITVPRENASILPWYYYLLAVLMPFICLLWDEYLKRPEKNVLGRAEKLRRLQFETRLGMWSPK